MTILTFITITTAKIIEQDFPVSEIMALSSMAFDPDASCYSSPCRCGGSYDVTRSDLEEGVAEVCCTTCTLCIQVIARKDS